LLLLEHGHEPAGQVVTRILLLRAAEHHGERIERHGARTATRSSGARSDALDLNLPRIWFGSDEAFDQATANARRSIAFHEMKIV
jgi:hypothetical protein